MPAEIGVIAFIATPESDAVVHGGSRIDTVAERRSRNARTAENKHGHRSLIARRVLAGCDCAGAGTTMYPDGRANGNGRPASASSGTRPSGLDERSRRR